MSKNKKVAKSLNEQAAELKASVLAAHKADLAIASQEIATMCIEGKLDESTTNIVLAALVSSTVDRTFDCITRAFAMAYETEFVESQGSAPVTATAATTAVVDDDENIPGMPEGTKKGSYTWGIYKSIHDSNKRTAAAVAAEIAANAATAA